MFGISVSAIAALPAEICLYEKEGKSGQSVLQVFMGFNTQDKNNPINVHLCRDFGWDSVNFL